MRHLLLLLFPFALIYQCVIFFRLNLYRLNILKRKEYQTCIICVGNLFLGGTGKTPMVEYLMKYYTSKKKKVAVLSRGYKRKTKGFIELSDEHTAKEVGDEPLQYKTKWRNISVFVCENRRYALGRIATKFDVVVMDDGFQHLGVKPSKNILLFDYSRICKKQYWFPAGILREPLSAIQRADHVVITKCPPSISSQTVDRLLKKMNIEKTRLSFSTIQYDTHIVGNDGKRYPINKLSAKKTLILVGIANPQAFIEYIHQHTAESETATYSDHHFLSKNEITKIKKKLKQNAFDCIITTEKDYVRMRETIDFGVPVFYLPISVQLLDSTLEKSVLINC